MISFQSWMLFVFGTAGREVQLAFNRTEKYRKNVWGMSTAFSRAHLLLGHGNRCGESRSRRQGQAFCLYAQRQQEYADSESDGGERDGRAEGLEMLDARAN